MVYLLVLSASALAVLAAFAWAAAAAFRDEHLVMMHWRDAGTMFLERVAGRYETCEPVHLPGAVMRFAALKLRAQAEHARARASERRHVLFHPHKA